MVLSRTPTTRSSSRGGTVARWSRKGGSALRLCHGRVGGVERAGNTREAMREVREREMRAAADILGVASVTFLGEVDGFLAVTPETRRKVTREVRRLRPDVLVAPDPSRLWSGSSYINHADHKTAGELALCAVMPDAPTRVMFQELEDEGLEPFEVPNLYLSAEEADTFVDITDTLAVKLKALSAHASQLGPDVEERVTARAREVGERAGCEFAEGFRAFRLTDDEDD